MVSMLTKERLLGTALGSILTGWVVFEHRESIYKSISDFHSQPGEPILGRKTRQELAHLWNISLEKIIAPIIQSLSSHLMELSLKNQQVSLKEHTHALMEYIYGHTQEVMFPILFSERDMSTVV